MGKCSFTNEWLDRKDGNDCKVSEWGRKHNDEEAFCVVCDKNFSVSKGFYSIKQHSLTEKHKINMKVKAQPSQQHLVMVNKDNNVTSISLISPKDAAYKAELIWCMKIAASNLSANSSQNIGEVFKAMFPGPIHENFSLNPTKVGYFLTEALAPYFREMFLREISGEYFCLQFDETTNNAGAKELQTVVRFWSRSKEQIVSKHLENFFLGHATGEDVASKLITALDNANLPLMKILMLGSDGPNVNKTVLRLVNEQVKVCRPESLIDIGFCNLHVINNSFHKRLEQLGCDASDFITCIHDYFHNWPSRWEDFQKIQKKKKLPDNHFLRHVSSRWLTLKPAVERVLKQWDAVINYFLEFIPSKASHLMNSIMCKKIVSYLKKKTIRAELFFLVSSANLFNEFMSFFQRDEPLVHLLYDHIRFLLEKLVILVCKEESIKLFDLFDEELFEPSHLLPPSSTILSSEVMSCLSAVPLADKNNFFSFAQNHYVAAAKYIVQKFKPNNIQYFKCLSPKNIPKPDSLNDITEVAHILPLQIDSSRLKAEYMLLRHEKEINFDHDGRVDDFWANVFKLKSLNDFKYPTLAVVVKAALTLSHGNANVERGFSRSARVLTEDRASMSSRMLNARLTIMDGVQSYDNRPEHVPITKELLSRAHGAYNSYCLHLENERKKKEEEMQKKDQDAAVNEMLNLKDVEDKKKEIEKLKKELKSAKKDEIAQCTVSSRLLSEANTRLKKAVDSRDFVEAKIAQTMVEGLMKAQEECKEKRKAVSVIEKKIEKRKDSVITSFFNKKPKTQ